MQPQVANQAIAAFKANPGIVLLRGTIQHYDWGGYEFIPSLLRLENREKRPFAELWIGTHRNGPATARLGNTSLPLDQLLERAANEILGAGIASRFEGRLPYLLKVLDARKMLSIQAHPTKAQAAEGFARENAAGISLQADRRNYKDDNPKPEVHVALTDFWMLHGFRPLEEIEATLRAVPELRQVMPDFGTRLVRAGQDSPARKELLRELYRTVMTMPQDEADALLRPLVVRLQKAAPRDKRSPDFWALQAARQLPLPGGHQDRGLFSIYLLNLVHLRPGQGTFQPAGTLHAYLEGANVELMTNSDNVLRGGLTPKHVDVSELLRTLTFASGKAEVLDGARVSATETVYRTPADEFELSCIQVAEGRPHESGTDHSADVLILIEGSACLRAGDQLHCLARGDVLLAPHGIGYVVESRGSAAALFKAAIPCA